MLWVLRAVSFLVVCGGAHLLAVRWIVSVFPCLRARRQQLFAGAVGLTIFLTVLRMLGWAFRGPAFHRLLSVAMIELAIVVISLLPLGLLALASRTAAAAIAKVKPPANDAAAEARISRREAIERAAGLSVVATTSVALGWGFVRGRHAFALEEVAVKIVGWPRALDGYVIAQVSDIHVGAFVGHRELDEGFELVGRVRPDLVVATGDLVDVEAAAIDPLVARLLGVSARDGAYAILGNHDHYAGAAVVAARIAASKVRLLHNEGVRVRPDDGGGFALLGVDDVEGRLRRTVGHNGPDLGRALVGLPPDLPRILLAHRPTFFNEAQGRVALQLSGHTHGGQINPGFRPAAALMPYVEGRYERAGSTLWVNRGFGVVGPPARIRAAPEITKIVIVAA
jgi:predicted MPP superfamily phosphohydrolase